MSREEFKKFIESIGFKSDTDWICRYRYKEYTIITHPKYNTCDFYNGSEWVFYNKLNDIRPFDMYFKQELRSFKLKELLRCV